MRRKFGRRVRVLRRDAAAEAECREALEKALARWLPAVDLDLTRGLFTAMINLTGTPAARLWEREQLGQQMRQHVDRRCCPAGKPPFSSAQINPLSSARWNGCSRSPRFHHWP